MLWLQGWDDAPDLVRACRRSWEQNNPGWDVRALTAVDLAGVIPEAGEQGTWSANHYANRVRVELLRKYGGVWADATAFCTKPLDDWLTGIMEPGFFAFASPLPGRPMSNWFLAAAEGSVIISKMSEGITRLWEERSEGDQYHWFHAMFGKFIDDDREFAAAWKASARISADGPHYFAPYGPRFTGPLTRGAQARLAARTDPVYKLTHKIDASSAHPDSAYQYFVDAGRRPLDRNPAILLADRASDRFRHAVFNAAVKTGVVKPNF